ncbi:MAG: 6-hydroxycyclohex-1-ene-1-carbonyl-CoA dehydrogenase [Acidiferrobacteraceae bacterium]|jgi:6-hydroxycyclohex-1-ene-1-carbonyl-CoA dehydrogenase|nr:6-hydroxycyclohex-1-ene-1-carbonyl-CoA dehydrogenase [Acidiferrobacteraceae bacterium]MDP6399556.1 6-hydroxycyclohex-1-ene-1-carbonyl-CoA dehydrogenase [Arenicellales bacterium]MDP6552249.1 6-hydroxycyclohex-1-ene-1-carbonyl-CoA dehydrogenase [Arenicellales bacterium]MDP6790530.1 6-hydroxycyclohex-1-ene-1-carbonyl-CoA dehydrogenase [Arenicellales bacterium]MDP6917768.1 6-hydroxycyclohex-1-ene-1-carbonyl-CoA dehydrogenase [Arenicellales bacterium]|tara:strand:+ start:11093 stop:12160 length:1068 start_codon:yes stop_codon:yes gene_type:complete
MTTAAYSWVFSAPGEPLQRTPLTLSPPPPGQVTVEIAGCGVCHTDLGYYYDGVKTNRALPLVLGHEISGRVIAAGDGATSWLDRAVIVPAVIPCGQCGLCQRGKETICRSQQMPGNDIDGGFASHIQVPAHGLCEVDLNRLEQAGLTLPDLAVVADAVTTPYLAAMQAQVQSGDLVIVIGAGGIGSYAVQIASALGAHVVAVDIDSTQFDLLESHGAALTLDARKVEGRELKKVIRTFAREQHLADTEWKIFECSGTGAGQQSAFSLMNHGATLAVVGFTMEKSPFRLSNLMAFHAKALGNWGCPPSLYPAALDLILTGKVALGPFIGQHPLDEINEIFAAAHDHRLDHRAILVP